VAQQFDIIVVGAGLIGAAFALDIASSTSLKVALLERSQAIASENDAVNSNQRVVALGGTAIDLLKKLDVFASLKPHQAHAYDSMRVWDENSSGELHFKASELAQAELGFMVDAQACTQALQAKALSGEQKNLQCFFGTELHGLSLNRNGVELTSDQGTMHAKLVVGADGARSWVRHQAKIFANRRAYNQQGIVAKIRTSDSHTNCAWQRFLASGPVAALPVHDNYSSIVWSADSELANELLAMNDVDFSAALAHAFDQRLGDVLEVSPRQSFPLLSQQASSYIGESLVLIGDAAHSIHPLAGQGANLGFKDARVLTEVLSQSSPDAIGELPTLSAYQRKRQPDNLQTDWLMSALNTSFSNQAPLWLGIRGAGMNFINHRSGLKKLLAEQVV